MLVRRRDAEVATKIPFKPPPPLHSSFY